MSYIFRNFQNDVLLDILKQRKQSINHLYEYKLINYLQNIQKSFLYNVFIMSFPGF